MCLKSPPLFLHSKYIRRRRSTCLKIQHKNPTVRRHVRAKLQLEVKIGVFDRLLNDFDHDASNPMLRDCQCDKGYFLERTWGERVYMPITWASLLWAAARIILGARVGMYG